MSNNTRLRFGIALLMIGLVMPLGTFYIADTDWPTGVKAIVGGILFFGLEIMAIPAVALMGKDNFDRIVTGVKRLLKQLKPTGTVSRTRYLIGLVMFVAPILFAWIVSYVPSWLPDGHEPRLAVNLALDVILLTSLFVLGGDFWDKLQSLFLYDARVIYPASSRNNDVP